MVNIHYNIRPHFVNQEITMDNRKNKLHQGFDEDVRVEREERGGGGHMVIGYEICRLFTNTDIIAILYDCRVYFSSRSSTTTYEVHRRPYLTNNLAQLTIPAGCIST